MNPRLYGYISNFDDFYPNKNGYIKKKIVLKVSDYRSAIIQGKFLAKKGLWVSEYRIESGLNCGGHAFATDGNLMGPILAEFRDRRKELVDEIYAICSSALKENGANKVYAYIVHPVLSGNAIEKISQSKLDQLVVTDTIPLSEEAQDCKKIRIITMAPTLAEAIRRVNNEESISAMFL